MPTTHRVYAYDARGRQIDFINTDHPAEIARMYERKGYTTRTEHLS